LIDRPGYWMIPYGMPFTMAGLRDAEIC